MKKTKSKTKICLSLLIAMAFLLPSAAFGNTNAEDSTEITKDASDLNYQVNQNLNPGIEFMDYDPSGGIVPLAWDNGWPINVTDINLGGTIAEGEYDITATFCRPDFSMGSLETIIYTDSIGTVSIWSDCDTVWLKFNDSRSNIWTMDLLTQGGHNFDASSPEASGRGTPILIFEISRDDLRVGDCNEKGFWIEWIQTVNFPWAGVISGNTVKEQISYDCGDAEIKKFLEIYKEQEVPEITDNLYCTDFEDPCEIYEEWATYDKSPDWGNNGAIDTWTWTDKKSNSPSHSFHCTAGDTYLMNQHDILEFNMDMQGLYMRNETGVLYDLVNITWAHWMEGDTIIVNGSQLIQDGGYVEAAFTSGAPPGPSDWNLISEIFFETDGWEDEWVNTTVVTDDYLFVRFVFYSDAAFCYEGWYIDDFCVDGIIDEFGEWEFWTDSHSHEQIMDGECIDHTFIESAFFDEGTYKICVWLQTLDDCHYASHGSDIFGEDPDVNDAFCVIVEVEDCLNYEAWGLDFDPESPMWEHDDIEICATSANVGTLDGLDAQVRVTVQYGYKRTVLEDEFDCAINTDCPLDSFEGYNTTYFQSAKGITYYDWEGDPAFGGADSNYRSFWHFADDPDDPGNCVLLNFDNEEKTPYPMTYPDDWDATLDAYPSDYGNNEWVETPFILEAKDKDLSATVEFDCAWALPDVDGCNWSIAVGDDSAGRLVRFTDIFDPTTTSDNDEKVSNGDGTWKHIGPVDVSTLIASLVDGGTTGPNDKDLSVMFWMNKDHFNSDSGEDWSGMKIDNVIVKKIVKQEEPILFQETSIIDNTDDYPENNFNITETNVTCFTWEDAGPGQYYVTQDVMGDSCGDPELNTDFALIKVVNYHEDMEDGDIEFVDNTCTGDGHWQVDDCCGGTFWCGDYETTMYGEFYDDCLYIAPYDEDLDEQNRTQAYGGLDLTYWTWYQINDTDDPTNFTGDWAIVECSEDGGQHWYAMEAYNGVSSPTPDPDGEDDWEKHTWTIPANVDQIRFRFESDNDTVENRGWMLDNISIPGIIDDECEDMENFEIAVKCYGNWWQSPDQYHYYMLDWPGTLYHVPGMYDAEECWWWWEGGTDVIPNYANVIEDPDSTFGCFDDSIPFVPCGDYEMYPQEINNSLLWTIDMTGMYYGYIEGFTIGDMANQDTLYIQYSADGEEWKNNEVLAGYGKLRATVIDIYNDFLEGSDTLQFKATAITDDLDDVSYDAWYFSTYYPSWVGYGYCGAAQYLGLSDVAFGPTLNEFDFYGIYDNVAPTTGIMMSGTYNEDYCYYTSGVEVTITAADDVSGIKTTYYELDGTVHTLTPDEGETTVEETFTISGNGDHTLCYWSEDVEGNVEDKKCVAPFRIDTAGPSVSINIEPGIYLFGNKLLSSEKYIFLFGGVPMTATASADGAPLKTVEFYINDVLFAEDTTSPFAAMCREKNTGGATFKVIAEDVLGETATATQVVDTYIKIL